MTKFRSDMDKAMIQGDYTDLRFVKGRGVCQIVIEVPIELGAEIVAAFGTPLPGATVPVVIARLVEGAVKKTETEPQPVAPAKEARKWDDMPASQQAGIRCGEPRFKEFLTALHGLPADSRTDDVGLCIRNICGVSSRKIFDEIPSAKEKWIALEYQYQTWLKYPEQFKP